ncbi:MAG: IS30 family transposase [Ideonella sp.]|nr:IS30 family transposase [Ideonella sp.]
MSRKFEHLSADERLTLASMRQQGASFRTIGQLLRRSASTLSRELGRNRQLDGYASVPAHAAARQRRKDSRPPPKLAEGGTLWLLVTTLLSWRWSPRQISQTLRQKWPDDPSMHVSHESIYNAIYAYPRGELKRCLVACLRQAKNVRRPRSAGADRKGQIPEMVSIHVRPPEVNDRVMPGHWEGDLIKGAANRSSVGVLVERTTRLVMLAKLPDATAESVLAAFTYKLNQIAAPLRQTLTYDQGREMHCHRELALNTNIRVYFCDPHSPWQKGSCENTNGLLRQFLPKGADLSVVDQEGLDSIADLLNNRPRETLNWRSPAQAFLELMTAIQEHQQSTTH